MTYLHTTTDFFRGEVIGFTYVFDTDIEVSEDLNGEIVDYSGCGYKTADKLLKEARAILNN
mgnify:FL=1